jgi:hypothetical protein
VSGPASRREHKQFCDIEGWDTVLNARGKKVRHHITYELALSDGRVLRTRISRPANNDIYGPSLWTAILRDQLDTTEAAFWDCVERHVLPPRPRSDAPLAAAGLPASLVHQLKTALGLSDADVARLSKDEAVALMSAHWARPDS